MQMFLSEIEGGVTITDNIVLNLYHLPCASQSHPSVSVSNLTHKQEIKNVLVESFCKCQSVVSLRGRLLRKPLTSVVSVLY